MHRGLLATSLALITAAAACGGGGGGTPGGAPATVGADPAAVSGDITVLTHRTDLQADGTYKTYAAEFNRIYPNVRVSFQAITAYESEVKIRMNTENYGDVLMIPSTSYVSKADYPRFFAPLGSTADLAGKYRFTDYGDVGGTTYGIAINGNANGFVYNKAVWRQAGISGYPATPQAFLAALQAIKDKTGSTPYYTNYHDGWPVGAWQSAVGSPSCDPKASDNLATDTQPWAPGKDLNVIDTLLYDIVRGKLTEIDPTTTNWEGSKGLLANGKIATMWLGSWAVSQMRDAATKAGKNPDDIGFMPFPAQAGGHFCSVIGPDFLAGINIHSKHREAARAWLDWFTDKSTYAQTQGDVPTPKDAPLPATLQPYQQAGVQLVELTQEKTITVTKIDNAAEIGLTKPDYRQHLVDAARGAGSQGLDQIFADLNRRWSDAVQEAGS
jgi:raffinose/stachyose/melibiose transport system substrate-binding protein